jgi:hypothetical protein
MAQRVAYSRRENQKGALFMNSVLSYITACSLVKNLPSSRKNWLPPSLNFDNKFARRHIFFRTSNIRKYLFIYITKISIITFSFPFNIQICVRSIFSFISIYLRSYDSCRRLPEPKHHSFLLTTDLLLDVLFPWLLVRLPSTFFLDVLFFSFPLVSTP